MKTKENILKSKNPEKSQSLKVAYREMIKIFISEYPAEKIPEYISENVTGFGTTKDEKILGLNQFIELIFLQYHQSKELGVSVSYEEFPIHEWEDPSGNLHLFVSIFNLFIKSQEGVNKVEFRLSALFEWNSPSWKLVHWHGSTPVNVENDAWHLTAWKKKNEELERKVAEQTSDLIQKNLQLQKAKELVEDTLKELKDTQAQLIQSEKMASLGELTAGIAHEIQNPLNFVNNFSEVSNELLDEMLGEIENKDFDEVIAICQDLKENLGKINHHGKRADSIVKGMLQHSRANSGQKEPTDINKLIDEYLRLSYHGLRAKDKSFNSDFEMEFDESLPLIEVVPQDFGRVILNMFNNSFHSVSEKKQGLTTIDFKPMVAVSTKNLENHIEIIIRDNGNGIPEEVKQKIFQPFFTTKPTGQGTGLGLSLSYDIMRFHGGEILVDSEPGEGAQFKLILPKIKL